MKHTLALVLMVFGIVGCQTSTFAYTQVYPNPLFSKDEKLSYAVRVNDISSAERYLKKGANPNVFEIMCFSPMGESFCYPPMVSAFYHRDIALIDLLITNGGDVNIDYPAAKGGRADFKIGPLGYSVIDDNFDAAELLLKYGANPNKTILKGDSPLIYAVLTNNEQMVLELLKAGANPNYKNLNGVNALTVAVQKDNPQIAKLLLRYGIKPDNYFWSEIRHSKPSTAFIRTAWNSLNKGSTGSNIIIGTKKQNVFSGDGLVLSANGDRYEGQLNNSQMHGKGKFILATGYIYEGDFLQGKLFNGQIDTGGKITKIANGKATLSKAEKSSLQKDMNRLKVEGNKNYKRAMTSSNNSQVVEDIATIGVGIVGFAIMLPLMIIEEILSGDVLHEVAKDLPAAYFENKRQQQVIRNAYVRGANSQRKFFPTQTQPRQPVRNLNNRKPCTPGFC